MDPPSSQVAWQRAVSFAARLHVDQTRNDGVTPFLAHRVRVTLIVRHVFGEADQTALVAALLHDLLEGTTTDDHELLKEFGREVADCVAAVSKDPRLLQEQRDAAYDEQLSAASWQVRSAKLADVYDKFRDAERPGAKVAEKAGGLFAVPGKTSNYSGAVAIVQALIDQSR